MKNSRRKFIQHAGFSLLSAGTVLDGISAVLPKYKNDFSNNQFSPSGIHIFSKSLQWLSIADMAMAAKQMGFDGIDLTVRPKGVVLPEKVEKDLPRALDTIRSAGMEVRMITTAITSVADKSTEKILKAASRWGIKYYRMGLLDYDKGIGREENIKQFNNNFRELQSMNETYGIHGDYQNHAGDQLGSAVIDLYLAMQNIDPRWLGCQYDIRHATVEGANSWTIGFDLLKNHIATINLKDFIWKNTPKGWVTENVPLGHGMVDFSKYFNRLSSSSYKGPLCLHFEYDLGGAEHGNTQITIPAEKAFSAMRTDLLLVKSWLQNQG